MSGDMSSILWRNTHETIFRGGQGHQRPRPDGRGEGSALGRLARVSLPVQNPVCGRGPLPHDGTAGPGPQEHGHHQV